MHRFTNKFIKSLCFYQMDSIGENTVVTCEKQSNFIPVLRSGDWSDIGQKPYMEDAHICIPNLAEKFGDQVPGKEIVSLYGVSAYFLHINVVMFVLYR